MENEFSPELAVLIFIFHSFLTEGCGVEFSSTNMPCDGTYSFNTIHQCSTFLCKHQTKLKVKKRKKRKKQKRKDESEEKEEEKNERNTKARKRARLAHEEIIYSSRNSHHHCWRREVYTANANPAAVLFRRQFQPHKISDLTCSFLCIPPLLPPYRPSLPHEFFLHADTTTAPPPSPCPLPQHRHRQWEENEEGRKREGGEGGGKGYWDRRE